MLLEGGELSFLRRIFAALRLSSHFSRVLEESSDATTTTRSSQQLPRGFDERRGFSS